MEQIDIDGVVDALKQRVAARRAQGDYPPGLEEQLEAEFKSIMAAIHRHELGTGDLRVRIAAVEHSSASVRAESDSGSRIPGGSAIHNAAARVVRRHTSPLSELVRLMGADIVRALAEVNRLFEAQRSADERQLNEVLAAIVDRLAILDHVANAVVDLERRLAALESAGPAPT